MSHQLICFWVALRFYENVWEVKQALMEPHEMKQLLFDVKQIASAIGDHEKENFYHKAFKVGFCLLKILTVYMQTTFYSANSGNGFVSSLEHFP